MVTTNEKSIINIHQKRDTNITKYKPKDSHQSSNYKKTEGEKNTTKTKTVSKMMIRTCILMFIP